MSERRNVNELRFAPRRLTFGRLTRHNVKRSATRA
jgi:hypothetical protein